MESSSFVIDFHPHLTEVNWRPFMLAVGTAGATSHWHDSHQVELTCVKRSQLQHVGYIVFRVCQPRLGKVIGVTGLAENRAGVYTDAGFPR